MGGKPQFGQDNILELGSKIGNFLDPADASDDAGMFETVKQHIFGGMEESALAGTDRYKATVLSVSRYATSTNSTSAFQSIISGDLELGIRPRFLVRARVDTLHSHLPDPCQYINEAHAPEDSTKRDIAALLHPIFVAEANTGIVPNDGVNAAGTALPKPAPGDKIWVRFGKGPSAGTMRGGLYVGFIQKAAPGYNQFSAECDLSALTALDGGSITSSVFSYNDATANECDPPLGGAQCTGTPQATPGLLALITHLGETAAAAGLAAPVVGSTYRDESTQSAIVAQNWKLHGYDGDPGGLEGAKAYVTDPKLYGAEKGGWYHTAFAANHTDGTVTDAGIAAATKAFADLDPSSHTENPSPSADFRMNSTLDSLLQSALGVKPSQSVNDSVSTSWKDPSGNSYKVSILSEVDHRHITVR